MNIKIERGCIGESILIQGAGTATANGRYCKVSSTKYVAANKNGNSIQYGVIAPGVWALFDVSTREETGPNDPPEYATAYRNLVADPKSLSFSNSWTIDLGLSSAPTSTYSYGNNSNIKKNGSGKLNEKKYIDLLPAQSNLTFLFDPIFYKNQIEEGNINSPPNHYENDPLYLKEKRDYQINDAIPNLGFNPLAWQVIPGTAQGTRKSSIKNNMFSYLKDSANDDVEFQNFRKSYSTITNMQYIYGVNPPKDNKKTFLILNKNDNNSFYQTGSIFNSTLNFFIKLQRPVSHKNPNTGYIVREKRGTFLTSYTGGSNISFGYRSPYYNINGDTTYKLKFEPFSFVFSFGTVYSNIFNRPINFTVMTDYKFKFAEVYFISIVNNLGTISIYINGEQQNLAFLPFNPLINRTKKAGGANATYYAERINQSPLAPGFIKKDGSTYSHINTIWAGCPFNAISTLLFGKSKMKGFTTSSSPGVLKKKRHLNNLDIGVITSYNIALSQNQIFDIYNNFRYRYI